jgi:broad specificity phosphatase PhoE
VDFGQLEGLTFLEIESNYPDTCHCWQQWSLELAFPGGENFWQFNARVSRFVNQIRNLPSEASILIVGHGGPFKLITCHLLGLDIKHWWQFYFSLGSISVIDIYTQGAVINLLNDTSYLQEAID